MVVLTLSLVVFYVTLTEVKAMFFALVISELKYASVVCNPQR